MCHGEIPEGEEVKEIRAWCPVHETAELVGYLHVDCYHALARQANWRWN